MQNANEGNTAQVVTLRRWTVVLVATRDGVRSRHVWGHDVATDEGRVSEAIKDFSMETMTLTTANGFRYCLGGLPGHSRKGQPAWDEWCKAHHVVAQLEVTNDYMNADDVSTRQFMALNVSAFVGKPK